MKALLLVLLLTAATNSFAQKIKTKHKKEIKAAVASVLETMEQTPISPEANRREGTFTGVSEKVSSVTIEQRYKRPLIDGEDVTVIKISDYLLTENENKFESVKHNYKSNECRLSFHVKNGYIRNFRFEADSVDKIDVLACFNRLVNDMDNSNNSFGTSGVQFNFRFGFNGGRQLGKGVDGALSASQVKANSKEI